MGNIVKTETFGKYVIEIHTDTDPSNPRREFDNLGTMVCFHNRHDLGDNKHGYSSKNFRSFSELEKQINKDHDTCVILPLYLYDHSGLTVSNTPFSCRWDSGQIGFIFMSKKRVREEFNLKRITKKWKETITLYMEGETETYDQYLTGQVYGYKVFEVDEDGDRNEIDSCWGYYGDEGIEDAMLSAKGNIPEEIYVLG